MSEEATPAAEPVPAPTAVSEAKPDAKPESPSGSLREQLLQLVPDDMKSQAADLIRSLLEHTPPSPKQDKQAEEQSTFVKKRYDHMPFRPKVVREESKREGVNYGSISD